MVYNYKEYINYISYNENDFTNRILSSLSNSNNQIADLEKTVSRKESEIKKLKAKEDKLFKE